MINNKYFKVVLDYIRENLNKCIRNDKEDEGDVLGLPFPYTVPSMDETMQIFFYWDTYFTNLGLLKLGFKDIAKNNADNLLYEVEKYGFVPNGNRAFFLNRSHQPYLSMIVKDIYSEFGDNVWLESAYESLKKEYFFWIEKRSTPCGLNRYSHHAKKYEVIDFYNDILVERIGLKSNVAEKNFIISSHRMAEAESGWDFTPRFESECMDFLPVDLNSNLYIYEKNFSEICKILNNNQLNFWNKKTEERNKFINKYLWNKDKGLFLDYNFNTNKHSSMESLASFYPLWAGIADKSQAYSTLENLKLFEYDYGISVCSKNESDIIYQWNYPNGWPPLFYITVSALNKYGFNEVARRIAEKYLNLVIENFKKTGELWEKYNVIDGTTNVNNEYKMPVMMGWTAGVFVVFCDFLANGDL